MVTRSLRDRLLDAAVSLPLVFVIALVGVASLAGMLLTGDSGHLAFAAVSVAAVIYLLVSILVALKRLMSRQATAIRSLNTRIEHVERFALPKHQQATGKQIEEARHAIQRLPRRVVDEFEHALLEARLDGSVLLGDSTPFAAPNSLSPRFVKASGTVTRSQPHQAGRAAADLEVGEASLAQVGRLLSPNVEARRVIMVIGDERLVNRLEEVGDVHPITPLQLNRPVLKDAGYVVVDEKSTRDGPWRGVLTSQQTHLCTRLLGMLKSYQGQGAIVVAIRNGPRQHFCNWLEGVADTVVSAKTTNAYPSLPVMTALHDYMKEQG